MPSASRETCSSSAWETFVGGVLIPKLAAATGFTVAAARVR